MFHSIFNHHSKAFVRCASSSQQPFSTMVAASISAAVPTVTTGANTTIPKTSMKLLRRPHRFYSRSLPKYVPPPEHPDIERLLQNNKQWVDSINSKEPTFFPKLGSGQSPKYLYIGCADSRVAVGKLMGIEMGDVFIHRNIANMVVASDMSFLSVLSYAVDYLKVQHILVTGHYNCGGIIAAASNDAKGQILDAWLQNIRDVYRLHRHELDAITDETLRHRRMVELNVQEQCLNVYKTSIVQRRRKQTSKEEGNIKLPHIHGMVFDPSTGQLQKLQIDFPAIFEEDEFNETYAIY